ncbi:MAG TPA: ATP-dependent Clp protease proteolytic subunit [Magnetospirillaceae bacterium]|jgi:ATP-dependent Clp protease protease subunit
MDDEDEPDAPQGSEKDGSGSSVLENRLLRDRKVMVFGQINDKLAKDVVSRLLTLAEESDKPIDVYVNSPGGHVESGDSIHDTIKFLHDDIPIRMIGTGWVASAGALIFLGGKPKQRICLPHTRFLLHQPMGGFQGKAVDIDIEAREIIKMRERLNRIIADETGQSLERVARDTERNYWMTAGEAIEYGLCSRIIAKRSDLDKV